MQQVAEIVKARVATATAVPLSAAEINARLESQMEKLRQKDLTSPQLTKEVSTSVNHFLPLLQWSSVYGSVGSFKH